MKFKNLAGYATIANLHLFCPEGFYKSKALFIINNFMIYKNTDQCFIFNLALIH